MNLLLHLATETEAILLERARAIGQDAESLALEALRKKLAAENASPMSPRNEWHVCFDALIATMPHGNPQADLSRESVYDGCGE